MLAIDAKELWRQIPPEEKFTLIAQAHAKGAWTAFITIIVFCTLAVGLQFPWLLWTGLLISPIIFQFAAGKAWRSLRPRIMLEYLAARSAARRYAFSAHSQDLTLVCLFRGTLERQFRDDDVESALEAAIEKTKESEVWIALFRDVVVMMSEERGGARLRFAEQLKESLEVSSVSPSGKEYSNDHEILLTNTDNKSGLVTKWRITSPYPAALIVFEKKMKMLKEEFRRSRDTTALLDAPATQGDEDNDFSTSFFKE